MELVSPQRDLHNQPMSTITAPLQRPVRTRGPRTALVSTRLRRGIQQLRHMSHSLDSDRHATLCEKTLRPYYAETRNLR